MNTDLCCRKWARQEVYIYIQDFGQHSMEFVDVINDDLSRRLVVRPFQDSHVRDVVEGNGKLFCLASSLYDRDQKTYSTQLAVFDSITGEQKHRSLLPFQAYTVACLPKNNLLAIQFMDRDISFLNADTLEVVWQTSPLFAPELKRTWRFGWRVIAKNYREFPPDTRPYPPGCAFVGERLFEDVGGRIWGIASSSWGDPKVHDICGVSSGLFLFDVAAHAQSFHPIEFSTWGASMLMSPSPDGLKVVRPSPQRELGRAFDAGHDPSRYVWLIERKSLDLWSVLEQKPMTRLHVSDIPVSKYIGRSEVGTEVEAKLRRLADWTRNTKDRFRMPLGKPPGTEKLNAGYQALRDLGDLNKDQRQQVYWEEDSNAIWVATRNGLRRLSTDGKRGPLLIFDRFLNDEHRAILSERAQGTDLGVGETYPAIQMPLIKAIHTSKTEVWVQSGSYVINFPKSIAMSDEPMALLKDDMICIASVPKLAAKDIAAQIPGLVRIKSWNQDDVATGLKGLANTLRQDIFRLTANGISLVFQVRSSFLDEKQFIEKLREKDLDVVNEAKDVIDAWCAALREHNLMFSGNDEGAGPLSYVLEFIAQRDPECSKQLREYCLLRDGEHECYSRDTVLKSYLDRLDFAGPDQWRLGILYSLLFGRDGRSFVSEGQQISDWIHTGILRKAQEDLRPQDFAHFVLEELAEFEIQPDKFAAFGTHTEAAANAKKDLLSQLENTAWNMKCKATLLGHGISE